MGRVDLGSGAEVNTFMKTTPGYQPDDGETRNVIAGASKSNLILERDRRSAQCEGHGGRS